MSKFHFRLRELRQSLKLSQQNLADNLKISKSSVNMYERGEREPSIDMLETIADFFNVDIDYLTGKSDTPNKAYSSVSFAVLNNENVVIKKYRTLDEHGKQAVNSILEIEYIRCTSEPEEEKEPTITIKHSFHKVSAGHGFDLNNEDDWEEIEVPDTPEARQADFSLTISGDSMEPIYSDGDIVLVKAQPSVDIGETGIFVVNGSGYIKQNGGNRLISLNPAYEDIFFSEWDTVSCAGKVIGIV